MTARSSQSRAFTLLETILAVSIFSMVMGLVAVMWSQARQWTEDAQREDQSLELTRLVTTIRTQWGDRRSVKPMQPLADSVGLSPDSVTFVTASPVLFPQWPIVRAHYSIERDPYRGTLTEPRYRLIYTETRLPGGADDPLGALDRAGHPMKQSTVLLGGCSELRFERFGTDQPRRVERTEGSSRRDQDDPADDSDVEKEYRWRPYQYEVEEQIPAVRIVGLHGKERFTCVLVVAPLR